MNNETATNNKTVKYKIKGGVLTLKHQNITKDTFIMNLDDGDTGRLTIEPNDTGDGVTALSAFWTYTDSGTPNVWASFVGNGLGTTIYYDFPAPDAGDKANVKFIVIAQSGTDYAIDDPTFILKTKITGTDEDDE